MTILERIADYLGNGGLMMEHDKVRDLLLDCRTEIQRMKGYHTEATIHAQRANDKDQQLEAIKAGIKARDTTLIVDGNDMNDWGWTTIEAMNKACRKKYGSIPSETP